MSIPLPGHNDNEQRGSDSPAMFPSTAKMYAPPWARDVVTDAADAAIDASEKLRSALPPAPLLKEPERRRRAAAAFEGDVALRELRTRPALDPNGVPEPPVVGARKSSYSLLGRLVGAGALAGLAALFMVGTAPSALRGGPAAEDGTQSFWSRLFGGSVMREALTPPKVIAERRAEPVADRPVPMMERFAAAAPVAAPPVVAMPQPQPQVQARAQPQAPVQPQPQAQAVEPAPPAPAAPVAAPAAPAPAPAFSPPVRSLDRDEIAALYKRGEQLIQQGDIAAARLMFLRAAEVGDARSALALGASYDPDVLRKLGVLGVAADAALAREWYSKASSYGSREAAQRIDLLALGR